MRAHLQSLTLLLRLGLVIALWAWLWAAWPTLQAEWQLTQMPVSDARVEAQALAAESRFAEALTVLALAPPGPETDRLRAAIEAERDHWRRQGRALLSGALTGGGDSTAALTGAVVADLLVFGDVRDLVIQGGRALRGEPTDPVLVGLSSAGLLLTAVPSADLGTAVLKLARRTGALSARVGRQVLQMTRRAVQRGDLGPWRRTATAVGQLSAEAGPAVGIRLLRLVDDVDELPLVTRLARQPATRQGLLLAGRPGLVLVKTHGDEGAALLARAARHGDAGVRFALRRSVVLLRPHPLLGLIKTAYKGTLPRLLTHHWPSLMLGLMGALGAYGVLLMSRLIGHLTGPGHKKTRGP